MSFNLFKTVYNDIKLWYNSLVKTGYFKKTIYFAVIALICTAAIFAAAAYPRTACAELSEQTSYPEIFTEDVYDGIDEIADYAVGDGAVCFAHGKKIQAFSNETKIFDFEARYNVTAVDMETDGDQTVYYYRDVLNNVYSLLPDKTEQESSHSFPSQETFTAGNYIYYTDEGSVYALQRPSTVTLLEGCSKLKQFGESVYAVKENRLNKIDGAALTVVEVNYTNLELASYVFTGDTAARLKAQSSATFVMLTAGSYRTRIDLNDLSGRYLKLKFDGDRPETATERAAEGETALLLCTVGNAAIISDGSKSYITLASSLQQITRADEPAPEFGSASVCTPFDYIYSSPALFDGLKLTRVDWGTQLTVTEKLSASNCPELSADFYRVEFEDENGVKRAGYIPCAFLEEHKTDEKEPAEIIDPDYTEDDISKTVLITILVIALVLITLGYLTYAGTSGKNKKHKRGNGESRTENKQE